MRLKVGEIKPNPNNPRSIKDAAFYNLVQSLKDFPEMAEVREVVVNVDHVILGGNMRFKAMKEAGWKDIPVRVVDWPESKQREFIIKDNISGGEWDWDLLANEWDSDLLNEWGLDVPIDKEVEEDEIPEVPTTPVSKLGEIYQLGDHRLMCGDSTDFGSVSDLTDGKQADMVFTDPPYNVEYEGNNWSSGHIKTGRPDWEGGIKGDKQSDDEFLVFLNKVNESIDAITKEGAPIYMCYPSGAAGYAFWRSWFNQNWHLQSSLVWEKSHLLISRWDYHPMHEPILYGWKNGAHKFYGEHNQSTILEHKSAIRQNEAGYHPTQKPISLIAQCLTNSSQRGQFVLDLFGGSGSTLIACEQLDRTCYMMELDPKYCDVVRKRYHKLVTGADGGWEVSTPKVSGN